MMRIPPTENSRIMFKKTFEPLEIDKLGYIYYIQGVARERIMNLYIDVKTDDGDVKKNIEIREIKMPIYSIKEKWLNQMVLKWNLMKL